MSLTRETLKEKSMTGRKAFSRVSRSVYLTLIVLLVFGVSAVGKAAQRVRKAIRGSRSTLKSSLGSYLSANPWGYFRPIWKEAKPEVKARLAEQEKLLNEVMDDSENRVEKEFHVPSGLRSRVKFWIEVYSRFNTSYRIVHDRSNPAIIYGYIDFSSIYRTYGNERVADAKARQIEGKIVKDLKARIAEAAGVAKTSLLSPEERETLKKTLADFGASTPEQMLALSSHIRTQTGQRDKFVKALDRSKDLLPQIEAIFKKQGVPVALARLPFVESSFNQKALSKTGAMGIWQFMPETARLFEPNGSYAEWSRPIPQSEHAARFLKGFRKTLPNWPIAVTAYNSGAGRLARIVREYHVDNIEEIINLPSSRDTLGFAGKNFYTELLAANLVEAYKEKLFSPSVLRSSRDSITRRVQSVNAVVMKLVPAKRGQSNPD